MLGARKVSDRCGNPARRSLQTLAGDDAPTANLAVTELSGRREGVDEVLAVRVHPGNLDREKLPPGSTGHDVWQRRFREINDWEHYLAGNGIRLVKLFLNVSKEKQRARFLQRIDRPEKNWKFSPADVGERQYWDEYQHAYSQMLTHTSTE